MKETLHIYTRVSTKNQDEDGTSIDTQTELGFDHKVWNEGGASSHHNDLLNRPVLTQLMGEVENGKCPKPLCV